MKFGLSGIDSLTKEDLELFLEHILGLMVIDMDGKVVYLNQQCADYIEVDKEASMGKPIEEVFPETSMPAMFSNDNEIHSDFIFSKWRTSFTTQLKMRKDGEMVGVVEYDLLQQLDSIEHFITRYTHILNDEKRLHAQQFKSLGRTNYSIADIIGSSQKIRDLKREILKAASTNSTVVITGETGTGKELVAHSIHSSSNRTFNSFIKINAASLPETLAESEFFGYEEGTFTGAIKGGKKGKFELANQGTLFIDEINQMPAELQPKILRALQEKEIDKIGGEESIPIDVRIISATNQSLEELVKEGKFRQDLYYRLNVIPIEVPPLRERKEDIPELVMDKIVQLNIDLDKNIVDVEDEVYERLNNYDWPGNVRELYNTIENAMAYADGDVLRIEHLNLRVDNSPLDLDRLIEFEKPIEAIRNEAERKLIDEVLIKFRGNKSKAAEYLKIPRPLLYQKMNRLGIKNRKIK